MHCGRQETVAKVSNFAYIRGAGFECRLSYQIADFQHAFHIYKLGGWATANIAHKALGIPLINVTKHHIMIAPLQSSSSFPTVTELKSNLYICYLSTYKI